MSITVKSGLSGEYFSATVPDLQFGIGGASADVAITLDGDEVYSESLYPVAGDITLSDLADLVRPYAKARLVTEMAVAIIERDADGGSLATASASCTIVYCEADIYSGEDIATDAADWCATHFLTLLGGERVTAMGRYETLHYTGTEAATVTAVYADGTTAEFAAQAIGGNSRYTTIDVSPSLFAAAGKELVAYTVSAGSRTQHFELDPACPDCAPVLVFSNSFGCEEMLYCTGTATLNGQYKSDTAYIEGLNTAYKITETTAVKADTGPLTFAMADWCRELFRSDSVRAVAFVGGTYKPGKRMVVEDPKVEYSNDPGELPRLTFTIAYAQKNHNVVQAARAGRIFDNTFDNTFN